MIAYRLVNQRFQRPVNQHKLASRRAVEAFFTELQCLDPVHHRLNRPVVFAGDVQNIHGSQYYGQDTDDNPEIRNYRHPGEQLACADAALKDPARAPQRDPGQYIALRNIIFPVSGIDQVSLITQYTHEGDLAVRHVINHPLEPVHA
ncbi:hypothetical protein D3C81_1577610 [compost metagenome]